jgi:hypothetical protein
MPSMNWSSHRGDVVLVISSEEEDSDKINKEGQNFSILLTTFSHGCHVGSKTGAATIGFFYTQVHLFECMICLCPFDPLITEGS